MLSLTGHFVKYQEKMKNKTDRIFITWAKYGTRAASLAKSLSAKAYFIGEENKYNNLFLSALTYIPKGIKNIYYLLKDNPQVIIVTNTQWVVTFVNLAFAKLFRKKIILDSHSCAFDNSTVKYPLSFSKYFAKKSDASIVTNDFHKKLLEEAGADSVIINDIPFETELKTGSEKNLSEKFNVLYVCIFSEDEPFNEVIKAAMELESVQVYITGNYKRVGINPEDYKHVIFTGYTSQEEYVTMLNRTDVIMTLTTRENTMQRAGSEAISVEKPLITSDTEMLRNYFRKGTVFVDNSSKGIIEGIGEVKKNYNKYKNEIIELQKERRQKFEDTLSYLENKINRGNNER